ncbi:TPA: hypothetical protein ACKFHL_005171 [Klebsiella pneumoniae]|uniref:Uncharacterized protein n=1 Tax=Klebsiella pneumoniae TaxID=573 RepID=A0A4P0XIP6_KLEPN|nr:MULTISPECIES: hypothetical protein [Klebsiella]MCC4981730.1 hypothetical protein [Klebsiella pneumoniae]MDL2154753.1 hypothetical protein [Klebsiella quasipneumoniae]MDW2825611.1 hypothetical protein [Klebsiella quasipneumoniae]SSH54040.1 Uncharacterised protein [Klebsiella pneumoniae]VGD64560.1 Uncharacterised protein [Klebsiella pneumoniae]
MQINVIAPGARAGVVECLDDGSLNVVEGDFSREEMAEDLRYVKPNSATGDVNTLLAEAVFVLRSLEHVG